MAHERFVQNAGGTLHSVVSQFGVSGRIEHFRKLREDLTPHQKRVEQIAKEAKSGREYRYEGSVPRIVLDDWLRSQGKTWHHWATDSELKAKFLAWYRTEYKKLTAANYAERSLSINRSTAPKFGAQILSNYRKEMQSANQ